jgi:hypothetical protein
MGDTELFRCQQMVIECTGADYPFGADYPLPWH